MKQIIELNADLSYHNDHFGQVALGNLLERLQRGIWSFKYQWCRDSLWVDYIAITSPNNPNIEIQINYANFISKREVKDMIYKADELEKKLIKLFNENDFIM